MFSGRWIALVLFIVLLVLISREKGTLKNKFTKCGILFVEGMIGGLIIDSIGINAGYYFFPRHPIYSLSYFAIVLPAWGVFGMFIDYTWHKLGKEKFVRGLTITTPLLFAFYEGSNLLTGSWIYTASTQAVILGWFPLILVFAGCHRRRDFKKAIEEEIEKAKEGEKFVLQGVLIFAKVLLIVVMFPLLFVSLFRILTICRHEHNVNLPALIKMHALME